MSFSFTHTYTYTHIFRVWNYNFDNFAENNFRDREEYFEMSTRLPTNETVIHPLLVSQKMKKTFKSNAITARIKKTHVKQHQRTRGGQRDKKVLQYAPTFAFPRLNKKLIIQRNLILAHYTQKEVGRMQKSRKRWHPFRLPCVYRFRGIFSACRIIFSRL